MKREEWLTEALPWDDKEDSWAERALQCLLFLNIQGLLPDAQKAKAQARLDKQLGIRWVVPADAPKAREPGQVSEGDISNG